MKSTQFLSDEHKWILRALDVLDAMASMADAGGVPDHDDVDRLLHFFRWFCDAHHQAKEETVLFPAMKAASIAQNRPLDHMELEHKQERSFIEEIETALRVGKMTEFADHANRLSSTLRTHIYKEDRILFETADQFLSPDEDNVVLEKLINFETDLDKERLKEELASLRTLEWKYLRRK